jgi:ppGpp synthetase/RelA/SpoT-type nucleotidyltranferase
MIYPSILERKYNEYLPFVRVVAERVKSTLINFCESKGYAFSSRIKSIESLAEKIETGRFKSWSDLDDLFACTIIIPTLLHEEEVIKFCQDVFEIKPKPRIIKRGQHKKSPDTFKFDSTRIYTQLKKEDNIDLNNQLNIYNITFEIQVKSAFEHAWAVSTHDLVYKSPEIDWKRLRLAAQIKANVEQLDTLILAFEKTSAIIKENDYPEIKIKNKLAREIKNLFETDKLPDELKPKDMNRFCDNLYRLLAARDPEINNQEIQKIINVIKTEIKATSFAQIPRSISLFKYFLAILIRNQIIEFPIEKYYYHITEEVTTLYPDTNIDNNSIFLYSNDI